MRTIYTCLIVRVEGPPWVEVTPGEHLGLQKHQLELPFVRALGKLDPDAGRAAILALLSKTDTVENIANIIWEASVATLNSPSVIHGCCQAYVRYDSLRV